MPIPDALAQAAAQVGQAAARPLPWTAAPVDVAPREAGRVTAVDAGRAVLVDNGALWAVAVRAAAVMWPGHRREVEPVVHACVPDDAEELVAQAAAGMGLPTLRALGAEGLAEALMSLHEAHAARQAVQERPDLLLVDGALHGLAPEAARLVDPVLVAAAEAGVPVVGIAKRSGMSAGVPLVPAVAAAVRRPGPWAVPVPGREGVFIARLHARAPHAYRVDVAAPGDPLDVLGMLLPLARDAVYTGYPYPLALAHNAVALGHGTAADLRDRLRAAVLRAHGPATARWLDDPHAMLDENR